MKLDHALHLASNGFRIFPLSPNSKVPPKDLEWRKVATTDPDAIRAWWEAVPSYNIGVAAGAGTFIVDADTKDGKPGLESLEALEMCGLPTDSLRVATPSGGVHVYLRSDAPHRNSVDKMPEYRGIDIRADGGYVVGPGSTIDGATYEVVGKSTEVRPSPTWFDEYLVNLQPQHAPRTDTPVVELDQQRHIDQAVEYLVERAPEAVEGAGGDQTTFEVASACRDYGISEAMTLDLMLEHWNETKAHGPWPPEQLAEKVANAYRYATGTWGGRSLEAELSAFGVVDIEEDDEPANDNVDAAAKGDRSKFHSLGLADILERAAEPVDMLIDGMFAQNSMNALFGPSNSGKTFTVVDMVTAIGTGRPWNGRETTQGAVLYIAAEGESGAFQRFAAVAKHKHVDPAAPIRMAPCGVDLFSNGVDLTAIVKECQKIKAETGHPVRLIVLDTLAKTMGAGDENSGRDMGQYVSNSNKLRRMTGAAVLFVHHTGKDASRGARGHSSLTAAVDTELEIQRPRGQRIGILKTSKQRDMPYADDLRFTLEPVRIGTDARGRPITSCIVRWLDESEFEPIELSDIAFRFLESLRDVAPATWPEWQVAHMRNLDPSYEPGSGRPRGCSEQNLRKLRHEIVTSGHARQVHGNRYMPAEMALAA